MPAIIKDEVVYGNKCGGGNNDEIISDNSVEISWEDYQKLSEEEKTNGTIYFVPDYPEIENVTELGFIDTTKVLVEHHTVTPETAEEYTATEDCIVIAVLFAYKDQVGLVNVDNVRVYDVRFVNSTAEMVIGGRTMIPLKKGQTLLVYSPKSYASQFAVYGMGYSDITGDSSSSIEVIDYSSEITSEYFNVSRLTLKKMGNIVILNGVISPLENVTIPCGEITYGAISIPSECACPTGISQYAPQVNTENTILLGLGGDSYIYVYVYGTTPYTVGYYAVNLMWFV